MPILLELSRCIGLRAPHEYIIAIDTSPGAAHCQSTLDSDAHGPDLAYPTANELAKRADDALAGVDQPD